jgi:gas vesicle structural protein
VRVSLLGIEVLTIDARIVIASVDTYLRFAEAVNRLDLTKTQTHGLPELLESAGRTGAKEKAKGALDAAGEKVSELTHPGGERERQETHRGNGQGKDSS